MKLNSKIVDVGFSWASGENMQAWMLAFNQGFEAKPFLQPGLWLASHPLLCQLAGITTLILEFSFIAAVLSRRASLVLIPATLAFHLGILLTMNITVLYLPFFLVFANWETVLGYDQARRSTAPSA